MKKVLIGLVMMFSLHSFAQDNFYYYKDQKIPLQLNTQHAYILTTLSSEVDLNKKLQGKASVVKFSQDLYQQRLIKTFRNSSDRMANTSNYFAEIKFNNILSMNEFKKELQALKNDPSIVSVSNCYNNTDNDLVAVTNYIWVGLKNEMDIMKLSSEASKINFSIVGQNPFMPEWVMLCPEENAQLNQVAASNVLFETGMFAAVEPELLGNAKHDCTNDPLFANQWGLSNTGQNGGTVGSDTRVCGAWNYTTGSNAVDIAIIDEGVEANHPDLDGNLQNTGYNTMTGTSPSVVYGSHGTSCAGIAAAEGNNSLGVTGVAYNADWFSVSVDFNSFTWAQMSDGFNWARLNGAEILSNSWGWNNPSALFDAAVTNAVTLGRGGLGCVVLFSAGNDNLTALIYPKNSNPALVVVGAMSPCTERKSPTSCDGESWWGSNRGAGLDVMAPGVIISTTDRQGTAGYNTSAGVAGNYTGGFNGTSSACPHAAGVAALILSANPCLTQAQVEQIMKRTSRKVGAYVYGGVLVDGSWNTEMGHGLLDAEAAVIMASTNYLQNLTESGSNTHKGWFVKAGFNVNPFLTNGNYTTNPTAIINIQAQYEIDFRTGCDLRGTVDAVITSPGSCSTW
jgi:subtilisin family serine protease